MTFITQHGISKSASSDTHASISSVIEEPKRRSESLDIDSVEERSTKRKKTCTDSILCPRSSSPIKIQGPFPGYHGERFPLVSSSSSSSSASTVLPSKNSSY